jgi:hypothetical protein
MLYLNKKKYVYTNIQPKGYQLMEPSNLNDNARPVDESFQNPSALYRGAPFWSWNGKLDQAELLRQLDVFEEMGIGGVTIHPRTGLTTEYLGDTYMELVKSSRDYAHSKGMLTWLYDEDRWPSGFAGGLVTQNPAFRQKHLLFTATPYQGKTGVAHGDSKAAGNREENGRLLARYAIKLKDRYLTSYRLLAEQEAALPDETEWLAYLEVASPSAWFNNQTYVDTLNPAAMHAFIEITHERYKAVLGDAFGKDVPAIFTDEPQFPHKTPLSFAAAKNDVFFPWTDDLDADFTARFGKSILAHLPEVIWDLPAAQPSIWRYRYHEWIAERFAVSFADQIGNWCKANGIVLTGHMMSEATLTSQCSALGEAMRSYRAMRIPGIDMLCDAMELTTAKQAQSAARQFGGPGTMSELYGVTGWHFDFMGHKRQGDWQAALGVLFRVHHLSWYCMRGEAKRDYPASISYQSPWYKEYATIEDHFARVGAVLSRGQAVCRVGMLHPIESFWLAFGPNDTSAAEKSKYEEQFTNLTQWLLRGLMDFDYIAESLLPELGKPVSGQKFVVGEMAYDVIIVPGMRTIRSSTLAQLEAFADAGGHILFAGQIPSLVDVETSDRAQKLALRCECISFERAPIMQSLQRHRDVRFVTPNGGSTGSLFYQMRAEGENRYLFVCNTNNQHYNGTVNGTIAIRGHFKATNMDTSTGGLVPLAATYDDEWTILRAGIPAAGHLLLKFESGQCAQGTNLMPKPAIECGRLTSPVPVSLDEPNVLLFDKAEYAINGGNWMPETQILDIENALRKQIGLPEKSGQIAQPWVDPSAPVELARIALRLTFTTELSIDNASFALENLDESKVSFDGKPLAMQPTGYYTDKAIQTIALPSFGPGSHTIEILLSFTKETSLEWCYLLGNFGVRIEGTSGIITKPIQKLSFGDWTHQGLPFYGGNVTYHCKAPCDATSIQFPQWKGTTINVESQGEKQTIYRPPYADRIQIKAGNPIDITVFGHRGNAFGPVHLAESGLKWLGPNAYRTQGDLYSPEYKLHSLGILSAPILRQDRK